MIKNKPNLFSPRNVEKAKKHVRKMLTRIKSMHAAGKKKLRDRLIVQYQQSIDARVLAVLEAYYALPPSRRPARKMLAAIAEAIRPCQPSKEPVIVHMIPKPNGDYRAVNDFGIEQRARQYLFVPILETVADLHPDQYAIRGGVPAAIDRVVTLEKEGYGWKIETDVKNCFTSFAGTNLDEYIPVMKRVIDYVISATHLNVVPGPSIKYHFGLGSAGEDDPGDPVAFTKVLSVARQGLPQGSAVASIATEILLAQPLKSLPTTARIVCYADNILVMAKTKEDAVLVTSALWSALQAHPAGHLQPKLKSQSIPGQPFEFLGHQITPTKSSVNIAPAPKNEAKFTSRLQKDLAAIANPACLESNRNKIADDLRHFIDGWTASFWRCPGMPDRKTACLLELEKVLKLADEASAKKNPQP
jgi:hypothetical protein